MTALAASAPQCCRIAKIGTTLNTRKSEIRCKSAIPRPPMPEPVEAVTLDAAGTLFHLAEPVGETYADFGRRHGIYLPPALLDRMFRLAWKRAAPLHDLSTTPIVADSDQAERAWWQSVVRDTFQSAADEISGELPGPAAMDSLFESLFAEFARPERWCLYADTLPSLDRLASRVRLAVISNFDRRYHTIARGLGLADRFETVVLSGETGFAKPRRDLFDIARTRLNLPAERILHVGDDPEADWHGSREAGFQTFELRRPGDTLGDVWNRL